MSVPRDTPEWFEVRFLQVDDACSTIGKDPKPPPPLTTTIPTMGKLSHPARYQPTNHRIWCLPSSSPCWHKTACELPKWLGGEWFHPNLYILVHSYRCVPCLLPDNYIEKKAHYEGKGEDEVVGKTHPTVSLRVPFSRPKGIVYTSGQTSSFRGWDSRAESRWASFLPVFGIWMGKPTTRAPTPCVLRSRTAWLGPWVGRRLCPWYE